MSVKADEVATMMFFKACAKLAHADAIRIATDVLKRMPASFLHDNRLVNSALDMLMKFGDVSQAEHLFTQLKRKSVVSYGALMQGKQEGMHVVLHLFVCIGYIKNEMPEKALALFETFPGQANEVLYTMVFSACAALNDANAKERGMKLLKQMPLSFHDDLVLISSAVHMLMKFGHVEDAERLFRCHQKKSVVFYGVLMKGKGRFFAEFLREVHRSI